MTESLIASTANDSAMPDIEEPALLMTSPKKNLRKFVSSKGERWSRRLTARTLPRREDQLD